MPIYDHMCDHCGHAFSVVRSYSDPPVDKCPSCGKTPRRLIAPPAIVFKGSGWYKTDSRASTSSEKDGAKAAEPAKAETKGGETKAGEGKSETAKPAKAATGTSEAAS